MAANNDPIFSRLGDVQAGGILTAAANDYTGQSINYNVIFTADETNGGYLQRVRAKALGTNVASVIRFFINNGKGRLLSMCSAPASPAGTAGTAGTLATGSYYAKVVAYDQYGVPSTASAETAAVAVTGPTGSVTWSWTAVTSAVKYRVYVGNVTGGQLVYFETTTNSFLQTAPIGTRDTLNGSTLNNTFYGEMATPATSASTTAPTAELDYAFNFALAPGQRVLAGLSTAVASGWALTPIAGSY